MTAPTNTSQATPAPDNTKELNFRRLEERYERQLAQERAEKERLAQELAQRQKPVEVDDDNDDEPYVDKKKLDKKLVKFGERTKAETQTEIQKAVQTAIQAERQQNWLKSNPDFHDVLQHAETFAANDPELAETILAMPEGFERQKLVYKSIKALGLHQPKAPPPTIQDTINANAKGRYYQPSGTATSPYSAQGDFSPEGQKQAFEKMQALKSKLRLG